MVPASDDNTDANKPEESTSEQRTLLDRLKFWKRGDQKDKEPARLKTLPKFLMHWLTPVWIAAIGFFIALAFAVNWRGESHWPTAEAMKLCATIAGAGFAFSAWQQRSHDNTTRELERITDAQREEFWHMRNTAHALLSTNSYYEQYEGVCRYFELADQLNKTIRKESTTTQILNGAILSALCTHIRYLGDPLPNNFENENERRNLQNLILNNILERINTNLKGYWDGLPVDLTDITFLTAIAISNFTSSSEIHLNHSSFNHEVNLEISQNVTLHWKSTTFHARLTVTGKPKGANNEKPVLHQDNFPAKLVSSQFENISICVFGDATHQITPKGTSAIASNLYFKACNFLRGKSTQQQSQVVTKDADTTSFDEGKVTEPPDNYIWATISFNFILFQQEDTTKLYFSDCIFGRINPITEWTTPSATFTRCEITQADEQECNIATPQNFAFFECKYAPASEPQALHDDREENW